MKEIGCPVPVFKKGYEYLVQQLARKVKDVRRKSKAESLKLVEHDDKIEELGLDEQLLSDDSQKMARLRAQIPARDLQFTPIRVAALQLNRALETITRDHVSLQSEVEDLHAARRRRENVLRDFSGRLCSV